MTNTKLSKIRKCKGCGLPLSKDPKNLAYTPDLKFDYCQRCFRLKHYGVDSHTTMAVTTTNDVLANLKIIDRDYVFCVNDIMNIDFEVLKHFAKHRKLICLMNKADLIVNDFNYVKVQTNILNILKDKGIKPMAVILTSTINNNGIRRLTDFISKQDWNEKIYFVGHSNSGKSSLINALINYVDSKVKPLTVSHFVNTTIDVKQIKLLKHNIIDTPGYHGSHSILVNLKNSKDIGILQNKHRIKPVNFQIHEPQSFMIDNLVNLSCTCAKLGSVIFYVSNQLNIQRMKTENLSRNWKNKLNQRFQVKPTKFKEWSFKLDPIKKYNIHVFGLGMILVKGLTQIKINTFENVEINLLEKAII